MTDFAVQWSDAKKKALKGPISPDAEKKLSKGADLGPALKTFDKAGTHEERMKAVGAVLKAKDAYAKTFKELIKATKAPNERKVLETLDSTLHAIWLAVEKATQPPRPSGSMKQFEVLREFNLASGLKPKYLDLQATRVTVYVEIDDTLVQLIKNGEESLKLQHLGDVAKAEIEKVRSAFTDTIKTIEGKIERDMGLLDTKAKEANEVLKHYARIVEDRVNKAVSDEWARYLARAKHLSDFKFKCGMKIVLGVVGVGVATATLALSFGTAWMNVLAIAKGVTELVQTISTLTQDIDKTAKSVETNLARIGELHKQRERAIQENGGQKLSKSKEASKELLNAILPISKVMMKSCSTVEADAKQLLGQVSKLEVSADKAVGAMNKALKELNGIPAKGLTAQQQKMVNEMDARMSDFFTKITALHEEAQRYAKLGEKTLEATEKLRKTDGWSINWTERAGSYGTKGAAAFAAANFIYQCAKAGKSLIPM